MTGAKKGTQRARRWDAARRADREVEGEPDGVFKGEGAGLNARRKKGGLELGANWEALRDDPRYRRS